MIVRKGGSEFGVDSMESANQFENGIFSELRLGGMGRFTFRFQSGPQTALCAVDCFEGSGFAHDGEFVVTGVVLCEMARSGLA